MPVQAPASPPRAIGFDDLGVPDRLNAVLGRQGITDPFPIQAATLSDAIAGRDVCGQAPTGAGKTLAFGLAVLARLEAQRPAGRRGRRHPSALILVPTRELAAQIRTVLVPLAAAIGAQVASIYGGVGYGKQVSDLRKGADVIVACPGRLTDLVDRGVVDLSFVQVVVVDEADRMADMGFLPAVRRLVDLTSRRRQMLLFSATLAGPVQKLIRDYQQNPARHHVRPADGDCGQVEHRFWSVDAEDRTAVTADTVSAHGPAIVFCRTKRGADRLSQRLSRSGLQSAAIHGDRSQAQRDRALASFKAGHLDVLVATDIAARGIHVDAVPLVVHFDPPADHTDYVHRAGRTGRAGADGLVVSLISHQDRNRTGLLQRKLGIATTITPPDLLSVGSVTIRSGARQAGDGAATTTRSASPPATAAKPGDHKRSRPGRPRRRRTGGAVRR